jgi:drug/metabolite transporter (DMT)-like permease
VPDRRPRTYLLLVLVVVVWGSYPTLVKIAPRHAAIHARRPPLRPGLDDPQRPVLAGRGGCSARRHRADLPALVILSISGIAISTGIFYLAVALDRFERRHPHGLDAGPRRRRRPPLLRRAAAPRWWAGVACSAFGVLLTVSRGHLRLLESPPSLGDGIVLAGQVAWATYTLYGKRVLTRLSPRTATTAAYLIGTAFLVPLAVLAAPAFPPAVLTSVPAWGVVVFQGTLGTLSHVWYYRGVQAVGPSVTAIFMNLQPLVGVCSPCSSRRGGLAGPGARRRVIPVSRRVAPLGRPPSTPNTIPVTPMLEREGGLGHSRQPGGAAAWRSAPPRRRAKVDLRTLAVGVCGTDEEILAGLTGPRRDRG